MSVFNGFIKGKPKDKDNPDGPCYWNQAGFTLFVSEYEGRTQYSMLDTRTDKRISFFSIERKDSQGTGQAQQQTRPQDATQGDGQPF